MNIIHNETVDIILKRRTVREFKKEQIKQDELDTILTCGLWAPSARNLQPCHIRVVQSKEMLDEINKDFKDLVGWDTPAYTRWDKNPVYQNAPTVLFIYAEADSATDCGLMTENIAISAESIGLATCIIGSIGALMNHENGRRWKERMNINPDWRFLIAVAVGYPDESPEPKERAEDRLEYVR